MTLAWSPERRRAFLRDLGVFAAFALMTVVMTWPWAARLRDAASDAGGSVPQLLDPLVGLPPDVARPPQPLPRERLLSLRLQPGVQRAQLRARAAALPALRPRRDAAHGALGRDSPGLHALRLRRVPAHPDPDGLERRGLDRRDRLRVHALPLPPHRARELPVERVDAPAPRGAGPLHAGEEPSTRRLARNRVHDERAGLHPLVRSDPDPAHADRPPPDAAAGDRAGAGPLASRRSGPRSGGPRPPAVLPPVPRSGETVRLRARGGGDARLLRGASTVAQCRPDEPALARARREPVAGRKLSLSPASSSSSSRSGPYSWSMAATHPPRRLGRARRTASSSPSTSWRSRPAPSRSSPPPSRSASGSARGSS